MAKALKTIAVVAGVAALAFTGIGLAAGLGAAATSFGIGVSASTLFLVSGGVGLAASLLAKTPSIPSSQQDRLTASINPRAPRATVYGQTALATDVRYEEWSGADQDYCDWIIALASHAIDGVEEVWINTDLAWSQTGGVASKFAGYFSVPNIVLEGSPGNAFTFASGKWNGRLTGCAYLRMRFKVTGNSKKAESPFSGGIPTRITIIGRGMRLYDPRRDSTVPGGSGPMRAADQSTWRYTADDGAVIGENLALHALADTLGWRIRNPATGEMRLAVGSGVPPRRLNLASWIEAANLCDEQVNRSAGGTEPRYHGAVVLSEAMSPKERLDTLCTACNGRFRDTDGKLSLVISHNDLATAAIDDGLNDDDVVGAFTWNPDAALDATPNVVRGKYVDASTNSLYQLIDYPEVRLPSSDGQDRVFPLDLAAVESPSQAQRVAKQVLQRKQFPREFTAPFDIRAWKYGVGDVVPFTFAALSFDRKVFRVKEQDLGQGGTCNMTLSVEDPAIYAWDRDDQAPVQPAPPNAYDASKNPLILAIDDAGTTANWSGVIDDDGGKPEDGATNGATLGGNVKAPDGSVIKPAEVLNSALSLLADGTLVATIGGTTRPLGKLNLIDLGAASDAARRQLDSDLASLAAAVAQLAAGQQIVNNVFRDAGLYTDPANGVAKLFAVESRAEQISKLSVTLNAALASIDLKASVNYVDQAILQAQLGGGEADLESIFVRLTSAETSISGLQASVQLKADATIVSGLQGSVTAINQSLDALNGLIASKASQTVVDGLGQRLTLAEQTLNVLDAASITNAVTASRRAPADADAAGASDILALLGGFNAQGTALTAIAAAKTELRAVTDSNTSAIASLAAQLGVQIGALSALVSTEQAARVDGDRASATDLSNYKAATDRSLGTITTALATQADTTTALSGQLIELSASVGDMGTVTVKQSLTALADRAGKLEGRYTLAIDTNGRLQGFVLAGSNNGPANFTFVDTNLRMGAGLIIYMSGAYEKRSGAGFGAAGNLLEWFGPASVPIGQETIANSRWAQVNDGQSYIGGSNIEASISSPNRIKQVGLSGSTSSSGNDTTTIATVSAGFPAGGKIRITGKITSASATSGGGGIAGTWTLRFFINYGSGAQLIAEAPCSVDPATGAIEDGVAALSGQLLANPGAGGLCNIIVTAQRTGPPTSGISSTWNGSVVVEWVNAS